jgi:Secretion system C-terminal sorting domain
MYFITAWVHTASSPSSITFCTGSTPTFNNIKNANIDFKVFDATNTLASINSTGNIQPVDPDTWKQYNTYYITKAGETSFKFQITNRASGGCGNDFALDDIEVRQCPSNIALLPVRLTSFVVKPVNNNYVAMEWLTSAEVNSDYFIVERSKDGSNWQEVSRIKAAGNSSILHSYNETDYTPYDGVSYYRLQQIDIDGKATWSDVKKAEINTIGINRVVTAGPNPFRDEIKIVTKSTVNEKVVVGLYNMSGRMIKSEEHQSSAIGNTFYISQLSGYTNGFYIVRLQYPDRVEHIKLLKQ